MGERYNNLSKSQKRAIERALCMDQGYVLDFSNRTIEMFFEDHFRIDFYSPRYSFNGESKAKRLRAIFSTESDDFVSRALVRLWNHRTTLPEYYKNSEPDEEQRLRNDYFACLEALSGGADASIVLEVLEKFDDSDTLDHLLNSIERDVREDRFPAALDRLHTYCQRRFRRLLEESGRTISDDEPLHSRVGAYAKILETQGISSVSVTILKSSISVFERFNAVRNDQSLAHDNEVLNNNEARFVIDSIGVVLRFLKSIRGDLE